MKETITRYLISSGVTFAAAFALAVSTQLSDGSLTPDSFSTAAIFSILVTAARAGVKALSENVVAPVAASFGKKSTASKKPVKKGSKKKA